MPQGHDFIFALQDKNRKFWKVTEAGDVVLTSSPYFLEFSPAGWDDILIKNIRNKEYWGLRRTVTSAFKYVEDGGKILKHIYYKKGYEEPVYLVICEQRLVYTPGVEYGFWYKQIFRSEIDLSTFSHDGPIVTAACVEDGFAKHLKSNENTVYTIPYDANNCINIKMDGIVKTAKGNYINPGISDVGGDGPKGSSKYILPITLINSESNALGVAFLSSNLENLTPGISTDLSTNTNPFFYTARAKTINLKGTIKADFGSTPQGVTYRIQDNYNNVLWDANPGTLGSYSGIVTIPFDINPSLAEETKLFLYCVDVFSNTIDYIDTEITIQFEYRTDTTYITGYRPQYVFAELINFISNGEYSAENCPYFGLLQYIDRVLTSGDHIRGIEDAEFKISFSQFFTFFNTFDEVGIREKDMKILFDRKNVITDKVNTISLGEIGRPKVSLDKAFPYNELSIGYPDNKTEAGSLNGKNEVNTTFNFSLGTSKSPRKYQKVSPVKTGCYEIESLREEFFNKDTTGNKNDNEPFAIHVGDTMLSGSGDIPDHYELDRAYNAFVTGVEQAASLFNLEFSPKNCLIRSGDFLRSSLQKSINKILKFIGADRNAEMAYLNGGTVIVEKADVPIGDLADAFFTPDILSFETDAPEDMNDDLDINPDACFDFTIDGVPYIIVPMDVGINPKTNKKQSFTGLSVPENDLTKLIEYYG
jgi:hypothetical protein